MPPQNDEANLARIRDNQRRSRARRKEYQQGLEQRVRMYEEQGIEASTEVQQAARHVSEENRNLRALLRHHGVSRAEIDSYLQSSKGPAGAAGAAMTAVTAATSPANSLSLSETADGHHVQVLEQLLMPRPVARTASPAAEACSSSNGVGVGPFTSPEAALLAARSPSRTSSASADVSPQPSSMSAPLPTDKGKKMADAADYAAAGATSSSYPRDYLLSPGTYNVALASRAGSSAPTSAGLPFYGLDGTSTEDLQYASSPAFFDYNVSPHYLDPAGYAQTHQTQPQPPAGLVAGTVVSQAPGTYYATATHGGMPGTPGSTAYVRPCAACLSGMGCQMHGPFYGGVGE